MTLHIMEKIILTFMI